MVGKSHAVPQVGNSIYIDVNYKNPSVKAIAENFHMMPPRSEHGLYELMGRLSNDPPPEIREAGEQVKEPNCRLASLFRSFGDKGYEVEGQNNPICAKCPHNEFIGPKGQTVCNSKDEGFKKQRIDAIAGGSNSQIRGHYSQLADIKQLFDDESAPFRNNRKIWEEAGNYSPIKQLTVSELDLTRIIAELSKISTEPIFSIPPLLSSEQKNELFVYLNRLHDLTLSHEMRKEAGGDRFGLSEVLPLLGPPPPWLEDKLGLLLLHFSPNFEELIPDVESYRSIKNKVERSYVRQVEKQGQRDVAKDNLNNLPSNWFPLLLQIWTGEIKGHLSLNKFGQLVIHTIDDTLPKLAAAGHGGNIFLDATARSEDIVRLYQLDASKLIVVAEEKPQLNNLMVLNINFSSIKSLDWSDDAIERLNTLQAKIRETHPHTAFLAPKRYKKALGTDFHYGRDDRGTNALKDYDAIAFLGTPWVNVGDAKIQYKLMNDGSEEGFFDWYNHKIYQERIHGVGRTRAQWTKKVKTLFFVGTDQNFDFLRDELGADVIDLDITEFCPEAASKAAVLKRKVLEQASALVKAGFKLTQTALAKALKVTQGRISQLFGGSNELDWWDFKKILIPLDNHYQGKLIFSEDAQDRLAEWLETAEVKDLTKFFECYRRYGVDGFLEMLDSIGASLGSALQLLWMMTPFFDEKTNRLRRKLHSLFT